MSLRICVHRKSSVGYARITTDGRDRSGAEIVRFRRARPSRMPVPRVTRFNECADPMGVVWVARDGPAPEGYLTPACPIRRPERRSAAHGPRVGKVEIVAARSRQVAVMRSAANTVACAATMEFRILGPVEVHGEHGALALGGPKPRAILAVLALHANEPVSHERLALTLGR